MGLAVFLYRFNRVCIAIKACTIKKRAHFLSSSKHINQTKFAWDLIWFYFMAYAYKINSLIMYAEWYRWWWWWCYHGYLALVQSKKCTEPFWTDEIKLNNVHRCQSKCIRSINKIVRLDPRQCETITKVLRAHYVYCFHYFIVAAVADS